LPKHYSSFVPDDDDDDDCEVEPEKDLPRIALMGLKG